MSDLKFASIAGEIAREAGALLRSYYESGLKAEYKGEFDIVTAADRASEKLITQRLGELLPDHGIYGEEGTRQGLDAEYRWYVDPLDGTTNFAHGFPIFCVSMGCEYRPKGLAADEDGELVAGVIYEPLRDELFTAEKGKGAYLNGKRISVSKTSKLLESLVSTGFPSLKRHENPNIHFYNEITLRSHGARRAGAAAVDLAYLSCGRVEAFWEFSLNPWDTAAGVLLVREAGGTVTRFDGSPFKLDSREVFATNGHIQAELQGVFDDLFAGRNLTPIPSPSSWRESQEKA